MIALAAAGNETMVSEAELGRELEQYGLKLRKVVRFKHKDRVVIERPGRYTVTLYLKGKLEDLEPGHIPSFLGVACDKDC
jgi:hypothetical protein